MTSLTDIIYPILKTGHDMKKIIFQNVSLMMMINFSHDQNFIKNKSRCSKRRKFLKKCCFPWFPIWNACTKAFLQKNGKLPQCHYCETIICLWSHTRKLGLLWDGRWSRWNWFPWLLKTYLVHKAVDMIGLVASLILCAKVIELLCVYVMQMCCQWFRA